MLTHCPTCTCDCAHVTVQSSLGLANTSGAAQHAQGKCRNNVAGLDQALQGHAKSWHLSQSHPWSNLAVSSQTAPCDK